MHIDHNVTSTIGHLIDGKLVADTARTQPVFNPATGQSTTNVALASQATFPPGATRRRSSARG